MAFFTQQVVSESIPGDAAQTSKHKTPTIVTVPFNASDKVDKMAVADATGTTPVGDGLITATNATAKGVKEFTNAAADAAGKVQSGIAQAQSAAQDPASFAIGLAQSQTGISIPTSPQ